MEQSPLKMEIIKINGIELVEKGNNTNKWKEYAVKVDDYIKGTHYSIPLKKKDGEETAAYKTFKAKRSEWEEQFIANQSVEVGVACSEKIVDWKREGKEGTSTYKTIRFFKEADELRNELSKEESIQTAPEQPKNTDPMPLEDIPF